MTHSLSADPWACPRVVRACGTICPLVSLPVPSPGAPKTSTLISRGAPPESPQSTPPFLKTAIPHGRSPKNAGVLLSGRGLEAFPAILHFLSKLSFCLNRIPILWPAFCCRKPLGSRLVGFHVEAQSVPGSSQQLPNVFKAISSLFGALRPNLPKSLKTNQFLMILGDFGLSIRFQIALGPVPGRFGDVFGRPHV